jgi:hypothetical protein
MFRAGESFELQLRKDDAEKCVSAQLTTDIVPNSDSNKT